MRTSHRLLFAAIALLCFGFIANAIFYFQDELGLEPCPMCILSRYTFILIGVVALVTALHGPAGIALKIYASLIALLGVAGIGISARHSWLQHFPPQVESCGTDLEFLLNTFSLTQALPRIFAGTGSCSKVDWKFIGLSIPEWAGVWFAIFTVFALWAGFVRYRRA